MPEFAQFLLFLAAATVLAITPGPGIFYVAARTLAAGRAEGIASSLGTGIGGLGHVLAGAVGVSALIMASATAFTVLKWVGAAYLVFIGIRTIWQAHTGQAEPDPAFGLIEPPESSIELRSPKAQGALTPAHSHSHSQSHSAHSARRAFREGIAVEALNPKTAAFFLAFSPQFINPAAGAVWLQFVVLGLISVTLNTLVDLVVAFAASRVRSAVHGQVARIRAIQRGSGVAMIALGVGLLLARRPVAQ
ncbi:MAG: LysE family translocator [Burkholderiales bacterium]